MDLLCCGNSLCWYLLNRCFCTLSVPISFVFINNGFLLIMFFLVLALLQLVYLNEHPKSHIVHRALNYGTNLLGSSLSLTNGQIDPLLSLHRSNHSLYTNAGLLSSSMMSYKCSYPAFLFPYFRIPQT